VPSPEAARRLKASGEAVATEAERGVAEDVLEAHGDDPEAYDPVDEFGRDPVFDDGDPSERGAMPPWEGMDEDPEAADAPERRAADVRIVPSASGSFTVIVNRLPGGTRDGQHARQHDALETVCRVLANEQCGYLTSGNKSDLRPLTQADLARASRVDSGTVQRLVHGHKRIELPWGDVVPLSHLLGDPKEARVAFIVDLLRTRDQVTRDPGGTVVKVGQLVTKQEIVGEVQRKLGRSGNSEPHVREMMWQHDLPWDVDERRRRYEEGSDWWSY